MHPNSHQGYLLTLRGGKREDLGSGMVRCQQPVIAVFSKICSTGDWLSFTQALTSIIGVIAEINWDFLKFMAIQQRSEFCPLFANYDNLEDNPASTEVGGLPIQQSHGHFHTVRRKRNKVCSPF